MSEIITLGAFFISSASLGAVVTLLLVQRNEIKERNEEVDTEKFWDEILCKDDAE